MQIDTAIVYSTGISTYTAGVIYVEPLKYVPHATDRLFHSGVPNFCIQIFYSPQTDIFRYLLHYIDHK